MADPHYGSLPFADALAFLKAKLNLPTTRWDDLLGAAHDRAFVVAGAMQADLLADLHAAVNKMREQGIPLAQFKKEFEQIVAARGWTGWTGEGTDAGRAWRARVIYETNLQTSYSAGRFQQMKAIAEKRPYWRYRHNDAVTHPRPEHLAWDGKVLRHDDPWWTTHYPPNGFNSLVPWEGVHGKVMLGLKARYSGPIVEIIGDSGNRVCLTVYHPVLTDRGWMPAGQVCEGHNLLRYRFDLDRTAMPASAHDNDAPSRADEVFKTLEAHGLCSVPGAAFNLYGDMRFVEGDVDVVGANRDLLSRVQAEVLQFRKQIDFMLPNEQPLGVARSGSAFFSGLKDAWQCRSSHERHGFHALAETCFSFTPNQHGAFVEFNPRLFEMRRQGFSTNMETGFQFAQRDSRQVQIDDVFRNLLAGSARAFLPGSVAHFLNKLLALVPGFYPPHLKVSAQRRGSDTKPSGDLFQRFAGFIGLRGLFDGILGQNLNVSWAAGGRRPLAAGHFEGDYFTAGPYRDARIYETPSNVGGANSKAHRDIMQAHPELIELDRVKEVGIREFSGHVYDFQTKTGLILSLGGFCVSNCKCFVETLAERDIERLGITPTPGNDMPYNGIVEHLDKRTGELITLPQGVDKGWDYAPGESVAEGLARLAKAKATSLALAEPSAELAKAYVAALVQNPLFSRFFSGALSGEYPLAVFDEALRRIVDAHQPVVVLSRETVEAHRHHPEVDARDYALAQQILDEGELYQQVPGRIVALWQQAGKLYRAALKRTSDREKNYWLTLFLTDENRASREVRNKFTKIAREASAFRPGRDSAPRKARSDAG